MIYVGFLTTAAFTLSVQTLERIALGRPWSHLAAISDLNGCKPKTKIFLIKFILSLTNKLKKYLVGPCFVSEFEKNYRWEGILPHPTLERNPLKNKLKRDLHSTERNYRVSINKE